jgi:hypothetical protein
VRPGSEPAAVQVEHHWSRTLRCGATKSSIKTETWNTGIHRVAIPDPVATTVDIAGKLVSHGGNSCRPRHLSLKILRH